MTKSEGLNVQDLPLTAQTSRLKRINSIFVNPWRLNYLNYPFSAISDRKRAEFPEIVSQEGTLR